MSDNNENSIQKLIDESESLTEICSIIRKDPSKNNYQVHKTYYKLEEEIILKLENIKDPANSNILISENLSDPTSIEEFKNEKNKEPPINKESLFCMVIQINDDTKDMTMEEKELLSKRYNEIIEYLLDMYSNCNNLEIKSIVQSNGQDNFIGYMIKNIKSRNLKTIIVHDVFQILNYGKDFDLSHDELFLNMPNLTKCIFYINKLYDLKSLDKFENEIETFVKFISKHGNITFEFNIRNRKLIYEMVCKIIEYGKNNNLKIKFNHINYIADMYFEDDVESNHVAKTMIPYIGNANIEIYKIEDLKKLKVVLNKFDNLECLSINIDHDFLISNIKKFKDIENFIEILKNILNFTGKIKQLKILMFTFYFYYDDWEKNEKYISIYNAIFELIMLILPNTIEEMKFHLQRFDELFSNQIASKFLNLKTIKLYHERNLFENAFLEMKSLRNIVLYRRDMEIKIPDWIEIVQYSGWDPDDGSRYNEDYFKYMNTSFNCSLRKTYFYDTIKTVFIRNVLNWKNTIPLEEE